MLSRTHVAQAFWYYSVVVLQHLLTPMRDLYLSTILNLLRSWSFMIFLIFIYDRWWQHFLSNLECTINFLDSYILITHSSLILGFFSLSFVTTTINLKSSSISFVSDVCSCQCMLPSIRIINGYMYCFSFLEPCMGIVRRMFSYSDFPICVWDLNTWIRNTILILMEVICSLFTSCQPMHSQT